MLAVLKGNIFDSTCFALVNPVNCVGVAGKGLALEFRRRYPLAYSDYRRACERGDFDIGVLCTFVEHCRMIISLPTKRHWNEPSRLNDVRIGINTLAHYLNINEIGSVAIPALGCGLGNLDWRDVKPILLERLSGLNTTIEVYEPC